MRFVIGAAAVLTLVLAAWAVSSRRVEAQPVAAEAVVTQAAEAQSTLTGEWKATVNKESNRIQLNLERRSEKGGRNNMGHSYDFNELQGLTREQALSGGPVKFSLVREAGRIDCEGTFQDGKGSGTFQFTGNQGFLSAMKSRGFDFETKSRNNDGETDDRLFAATALNVTTALADDLTSAFGKLNTDDLFKAAIFKIDSNFAREMKASGFENLGMEELVKARIFKIDAAFVRQVSQMGFEKEPFESLVKMQIFKVTPEFISEVRNEGLTNVQVEELVKLRIFKIDGQFIREAKADGVPLEVEQLVQRRIGVARRR
jgi:CRISPR/Cas system-associated endoribonuclease Cas2